MGGYDLPAQVDLEQSLAALSSKIHEQFDQFDHFVLRYDHCLPIFRSDSCDLSHRIVAAYICHQPYRIVTDDIRLHPFRNAILTAANSANGGQVLSEILLQLVHASSERLESLASLPLATLCSHKPTKKQPSVSTSAQDLLTKATQRTLSMGEQRSLLSSLDSKPAMLQVSLCVDPAQLVLIAANHPILSTELVVHICKEFVGQVSFAQSAQRLQRYFEALTQLPLTPRSFDVITRLLRSDASAPAPLPLATLSSVSLETTVAHLARLYALGPFISKSITFLEQTEAQEEALIITDLNESGLAPFDRREVELQLEFKMSRQVGSFCHFVTSLLNSALLFPPDLGSLRRHISKHVDSQTSEAELLRTEVQSMELNLQSMTEATLIELKHFSLQFGRYGDGTRLYSQLSSHV